MLPRSFIEVDFEGVTSKKCFFVKSKKELLEKITGADGQFTNEQNAFAMT